jgi:ribosomal protein L37AE/L43A
MRTLNKKNTEEYIQYLDKTSKDKKPFLTYNLRFCYACKTKQPKGKRKAEKGWRCEKCINLGIEPDLSSGHMSKR